MSTRRHLLIRRTNNHTPSSGPTIDHQPSNYQHQRSHISVAAPSNTTCWQKFNSKCTALCGETTNPDMEPTSTTTAGDLCKRATLYSHKWLILSPLWWLSHEEPLKWSEVSYPELSRMYFSQTAACCWLSWVWLYMLIVTFYNWFYVNVNLFMFIC